MRTLTACVLVVRSIGKRSAKEPGRWAGRRRFEQVSRFAGPSSRRRSIPSLPRRRKRPFLAFPLLLTSYRLRTTSFCWACLTPPLASSATSPFASLFRPWRIANSSPFPSRSSSCITPCGPFAWPQRSQAGILSRGSENSSAFFAALSHGDGKADRSWAVRRIYVEKALGRQVASPHARDDGFKSQLRHGQAVRSLSEVAF